MAVHSASVLRKFKAQIVATTALRALATLVSECDSTGWPHDWAALREGARDVLHTVREETDAMLRLVARVDAGRGVLVLFADEQGTPLEQAGVVTVAIDLDVPTLLSDDEHGPDALRAFVALVERVGRSSHYAGALRMGTREAAYADVLAELARQAHDRGVLLEASEPTRPAASYGGRDGHRDSVWKNAGERIDPREVFGDGSSAPFCCSALDDLYDDERSFLDEAGLGWPVRLRALEEAWRSVAFSSHPDRRPDDPEASRRFVRLKSGYERLRERAV